MKAGGASAWCNHCFGLPKRPHPHRHRHFCRVAISPFSRPSTAKAFSGTERDRRRGAFIVAHAELKTKTNVDDLIYLMRSSILKNKCRSPSFKDIICARNHYPIHPGCLYRIIVRMYGVLKKDILAPMRIRKFPLKSTVRSMHIDCTKKKQLEVSYFFIYGISNILYSEITVPVLLFAYFVTYLTIFPHNNHALSPQPKTQTPLQPAVKCTLHGITDCPANRERETKCIRTHTEKKLAQTIRWQELNAFP